MARDVMQRGGLSGAIFNAAKERSLDAFIAGQIGFLDMAAIVESVLDRFEAQPGLIDAAITLDNVTQTDHLAREWADIEMLNRAG
jgi:1-deoxy-D-xylulose-5-phosphate reductoisomerase